MGSSVVPFSFKLPDGNTLTGWQSFPDRASINGPGTPLIVGMHGGSYDSSYFNASPKTSILRITEATGIPVISIDRPGYQGSSALPKLKDGETYIQQCGQYLNDIVLPHIWNEIAQARQSPKPTSIVLHAHSIGAAIAIVAAGLCTEESRYPLAGISLSGIGIEYLPAIQANMAHVLDAHIPPPTIKFPTDAKDEIMFGLEGLFDPKIKEETEQLNNAMAFAEVLDIQRLWPGYWDTYASKVEIPVFYVAAQHDAMFVSTPQNAEDFGKHFTKCKVIDVAYVPSAGHCIELGHQGIGYLTRVVGWAMNCANILELERCA
jgi:pimeloyl-ACP methyl ester carboxylesterase